MSEAEWAALFALLRARLGNGVPPSVEVIANRRRDPFRVLISTIISSRTKDEVTLAASERLFACADTPASVAALGSDRIAELIYPAGFYRQKSAHILRASRILLERYGGTVPSDREELVSLPGVGVKTANLTLNLGFGLPAICVDTHVHRISNRAGWVSTGTPEQTESALESVLPRRFWIEVNSLLVSYGKRVCTPIGPFCSTCPISASCPKRGVGRQR